MSRMSALFGRRSPALVGLDIGSSAVKAVELEATGTGFRVVAAGCAPMPRDAIVAGAIVDGDAVAGAIRGVVDACRIRARAVAASLAGSAVVVRKLTVPSMSGSELDESIYWEADQYVPFDIGDVTLDYQVLESAPDGGAHSTMDVLLVAAKNDRIADYARVIERAGLAPVVLDVDVFALHNAYEVNYGVERDAVVMLVHAGASTITAAVLRGGRLDFTRDVALDGQSSPERLARHLQPTAVERLGMSDGGSIEAGFEGPATSATAAERFARVVEGTMEEYLADNDASDSIDRIVVSGGWSCAPAFTDALGDRLGMPISRFEPFRGLEVAPRVAGDELLTGAAPSAAVAVGLACRRGDDR